MLTAIIETTIQSQLHNEKNITDPLSIFNPFFFIIFPVPEPLSGQDEVRWLGNRRHCGQTANLSPPTCHGDEVNMLRPWTESLISPINSNIYILDIYILDLNMAIKSV